MSAKIKISRKIRISGFSVTAYDVIQQRSENGLGIPVALSDFHKEVLPTQVLLQVIFLIILVSVLIPLSAFGYFLLYEQLALALRPEVLLIERFASGFGLLSTLSAILFILLFYLPLPCK